MTSTLDLIRQDHDWVPLAVMKPMALSRQLDQIHTSNRTHAHLPRYQNYELSSVSSWDVLPEADDEVRAAGSNGMLGSFSESAIRGVEM
jgi:hypothetical protein